MKPINLALIGLLLLASDHGGAMARLNEDEGRQLGASCGKKMRAMYAIVCNDGSTQLHCGPYKKVIDFCSKPYDPWLEKKCKKKGGFKEMLTPYSGCYPSRDVEFWAERGVDISTRKGPCHPKLNIDPTTFFDTRLKNPGFELGNFNFWDLRVNPADSAEVVCSDGQAVKGNCYAKIDAGNSQEEPGNRIKRTIDVPEPQDPNCAPQFPGSGIPYCVQFWYRFNAVDYLPYNDFARVSVKLDDAAGTPIWNDYIDVEQVGDFGDSEWQLAQVQVPPAVAGLPMDFTVRGFIKNDKDTAFDSELWMDALRVCEGHCTGELMTTNCVGSG